jgi:hypothetical protein
LKPRGFLGGPGGGSGFLMPFDDEFGALLMFFSIVIFQ